MKKTLELENSFHSNHVTIRVNVNNGLAYLTHKRIRDIALKLCPSDDCTCGRGPLKQRGRIVLEQVFQTQRSGIWFKVLTD